MGLEEEDEREEMRGGWKKMEGWERGGRNIGEGEERRSKEEKNRREEYSIIYNNNSNNII